MGKNSAQATLRWIWRNPLESVLCGLIFAMAAVTFSQVVARYVVQAPLSWSEELARFLLMWLSMLSAAYAFKLKAHFALHQTYGVDLIMHPAGYNGSGGSLDVTICVDPSRNAKAMPPA